MPISRFRGKKTKKRCRAYISKIIEEEYSRGHPQKQSIAIAYSQARKSKCKT